ncbi:MULTISPECIES: TonB-dependent receptor [unclassified Acinetobacter]|uniref:TonB-dependent receptor n=1 Tax=unclassified Acinetobacter TaxID=196816 RepID=UPI00244D7559|nr:MULTISPECIES: TonB-dependent receptor [unclassified Acinetobacter]MDH0032730.1 TonB-dependent receptor [Acinetobacter sp. GD04021]MDH0885985.1 TonB-dependent receptor [Acinetobacter sp. GD03873]MDH1082605.1 TonB-dependent receptor [Acinetobacter sp. GD03983]MDH2189600.1 TonB-dependent receptor [Acinetobacter sp. GD03645]MDH2203569.1 TonB-dependent receptor [Acinetobacter sp. GD03647]
MNTQFRLSVLTAACLSISYSSLAFAENTANNETKTLSTIVVTASREGESINNTPAAISKISNTDIEEKHATFIGQLVNQTPGVLMNDLGNEQHMMSIRQPITTAAVYQYLEDGVSVRPVGVFNHNALYEVNLAGIESIEILRGPASSLYGSNAIGGTINFLTKAPSLTPTADLGISASSEGYRRVDLGASNTFNTDFGEHGLRISGYASDRGDSWQDHAESNKQSVTLRHDWRISDATQVKNIVSYNHLKADMTGSLNKDDFDKRAGYSYQTFTYRDVDATRLSSQMSHQWSDEQQSQATIYYRDNSTEQNPSYTIRTDIKNGKPTGTYSGQTTYNAFQSYGLNLQHSATLDQVKLIVGLMADHSPTQAKTNDIEIFRDPNTLVYTGFKQRQLLRDFNVDVNNQAIYAQANWQILPTLNLVGGARYDWISYDYDNKLTPSTVTGAPDEKRNFHKASPQLGFVWNITPAMDIYSNWSQGFVPPEVSSLYGANLVTPNLKEATFDNVDTGLRFKLLDDRLDGEITLYRLQGKDEVMSYTKPDNTREPRNTGKTLHQGIEIGGTWKISDLYDQRLKLSGSWAEHEYKEFQPSSVLDYSGNTMPSAPKTFGTLEYQIKPIPELLLSAEGVYVGSYWMNDANTEKYNGHTVLNLRANYRKNAYEIYGQVLNVTDEHYSESTSYSNNQASYTPAAPRTYLLGLRYHFGK